MEASFLKQLSALLSQKEILDGGGLAFPRTPTIFRLATAATSLSNLFYPLSTAATILDTGILLGAGAKFKPLERIDLSAGDRVLEDRFTIHCLS